VALDCQAARAVFLGGGATAGPGAAPSWDAAADHVATCPACRTRLDQLSSAALSMAEDEISCAACTSQLHAYLDAEAAGTDGASAWPLVHRHLARCPECAGDYRDARAALVDLAAGRLLEPERYPEFDTTFLYPARRPKWRELQSLRRAAVLLLAGVVGLGAWLSLRTEPREPVDRAPVAAGPGATEAAAAIVRTAALPATPIQRQAPRALLTPATIAPPPTASPPATAVRVTGVPTEPAAPPPEVTASPAIGLTPTPPEEPPEEPDDDRPREATPTPTPVMHTRCELPGDGQWVRFLDDKCDVFPNRAGFDLYSFSVANRSRWAFSLCNRTGLDTILAIYADGAFDPAVPCQGLVAFNDDFCARQSRLTVVLDPGDYLVLIAEKSGDINAPYAFKTEAEEAAEGSHCPALVPPPTPTPVMLPPQSTLAPAVSP